MFNFFDVNYYKADEKAKLKKAFFYFVNCEL